MTSADLVRDGLSFPEFYGDDMLLPEGKTPAYLGQAVAILIYHDFTRFCCSQTEVAIQRSRGPIWRDTGALQRDPWGAFRFVRIGGATPQTRTSFRR